MRETSNPPDAERTSQPPETLVILPEDGDTIHAYGDTALVKLSGGQTNGSMVVVVGTSPPGGGPPPHRHRNEDEMFIVLEGKIRFLANGQWTEPLPPGAVVYTPRGVVHTFQNVGGDDLSSMDYCHAQWV